MNSNNWFFSKVLNVILLITWLIFSVVGYVQAQSKVGIQVGKSYSKFNVKEGTFKDYDFSDNNDHEGYSVNAYYTYSLNRFFNLSQRIGFVKRGAIIERDYGFVGYDKFSLKYLNMATKVGFSPVKFFNLYCGLNYNYLREAVAYFGKDRHFYTTGHYNRVDIGYDFGGRVVVKGIFLDANFFRSLKPIVEIDSSVNDLGIKATEYRNESLEFSIGYQLELRKLKKEK
jgi:hypothetical protein